MQHSLNEGKKERKNIKHKKMSKKHFMKNLRRSCLSYTHYSFPPLDRHILKKN